MFGKPCGCVRKSKQDTDRGTEGPERTLLSKGRVAGGQGEITLQSDSANVNKADMSRVHVMAL